MNTTPSLDGISFVLARCLVFGVVEFDVEWIVVFFIVEHRYDLQVFAKVCVGFGRSARGVVRRRSGRRGRLTYGWAPA